MGRERGEPSASDQTRTQAAAYACILTLRAKLAPTNIFLCSKFILFEVTFAKYIPC